MSRDPSDAAPGPVTPDIDENGVDRAQIRAMLALTPEERLRRVEEFVVVGMTAGILHGAPVTTVDLDVGHRRTRENVARLLEVLAELDAVYRHDPRQLRPGESHRIGPGHQLLATTHAR